MCRVALLLRASSAQLSVGWSVDDLAHGLLELGRVTEIGGGERIEEQRLALTRSPGRVRLDGVARRADALLVIVAFGQPQLDELAVVPGGKRPEHLVEDFSRHRRIGGRRTTARRVRARACSAGCRRSAAERSAGRHTGLSLRGRARQREIVQHAPEGLSRLAIVARRPAAVPRRMSRSSGAVVFVAASRS